MRYLAIIAALGASVLAAAAPALAGSAPHAASTPRARLLSCQHAAAQGDRFMTVQGAMRTRTGAARMGIRFDLLQRRPGLRSQAIAAPGLGVWNVSDVDRTAFRYTKRIENLPAPASYRVVVRFRWYNAKGAVVGRARRITRACRQPDYRPELRLRNPTAQPAGQPGVFQYAVGVLNSGRTAAANFDVALTVNGAQRGLQTLEELLPGARQRVTFTAARCQPGDLVTFVVDPDGRVDEVDETDDQLSFPCPAS
jgi:CARDB protein